jgi:hypothetical protein
MLTSYLDDSGTHDDAEIVLWAGLSANQFQWDALIDAWRKTLAAPCPGKEPISRFHMTDCYNSRGEFAGWKRHETDYLASHFCDIIIKNGIYGYAFATSRKDWDQLITGDLRTLLGDSEGFCVRNCYVRITQWAREKANYDPSLAFVFDSRPHREAENSLLFSIYKKFSEDNKEGPALANLAFSSSKERLPLQAADLFAWEIYQHANDIVQKRAEPNKPIRSILERLANSQRIVSQFADRDAILRLPEHEKKFGRRQISGMEKYFRSLSE